MRHLRRHYRLFIKVNLFYASFIPGLQIIIAAVIKERLPDVKIHKLLDGAVLFETETSYDKLNFLCFNNIFHVIDILEQSDKNAAIETHIKSVIRNTSLFTDIIKNNNKSFKSFRIIISNENVPAAIDEKIRQEAENFISRLSKLNVNRSRPDTEFWFLSRSEGFSIFMKRLTLHSSWEKTLHKGELPPPLAWAMCRLARPIHSETVLDPFCGYGSIIEAALKYFHIAKIFACDNDKNASNYTASRFKNRKKEDFFHYQTDFKELPSLIGENNIDVIVTDPPWGHYKEIDNNSFYRNMFEVFGKLLKKGGRAVVLCANDALLKAVPASFTLQESTPILLSGKKTVIYEFTC